jgi:uncharacterized protein YndB with AHSA1/START domain/uncharacterized protein YciI
MDTMIPPVRRQVVVAAPPGAAFTMWTDEIGQWWPLHVHSVYGPDAKVRFADGKLVEYSPDGAQSVWGEVLDWDPPHRLRITWHPGYDVAKASYLAMSFAGFADDTRTVVTLEHSGWEVHDDPAGSRASYNSGWPGVLASYRAHSDASAVTGAAPGVWLALEHTAGPAADADGVFAHADFQEHLAFLRRLADDGVLVAAGPLAGEAGAGMTVIKVPADAASQYVQAAQYEDLSVVRDLLMVRVRPWEVRMTG